MMKKRIGLIGVFLFVFVSTTVMANVKTQTGVIVNGEGGILGSGSLWAKATYAAAYTDLETSNENALTKIRFVTEQDAGIWVCGEGNRYGLPLGIRGCVQTVESICQIDKRKITLSTNIE